MFVIFLLAKLIIDDVQKKNYNAALNKTKSSESSNSKTKVNPPKRKSAPERETMSKFIDKLRDTGEIDSAYEYSRRLNSELSSKEIKILDYINNFFQSSEFKNYFMAAGMPDDFFDSDVAKERGLHKPKPLQYKQEEMLQVLQKALNIAREVRLSYAVDALESHSVVIQSLK